MLKIYASAAELGSSDDLCASNDIFFVNDL